jgi:hypothetical protein
MLCSLSIAIAIANLAAIILITLLLLLLTLLLLLLLTHLLVLLLLQGQPATHRLKMSAKWTIIQSCEQQRLTAIQGITLVNTKSVV